MSGTYSGCPAPRRNRLGDDECPGCGASWDPADGPPVCPEWRPAPTVRRPKPTARASDELAKIRAILAGNDSTDS